MNLELNEQNLGDIGLTILVLAVVYVYAGITLAAAYPSPPGENCLGYLRQILLLPIYFGLSRLLRRH